MAPPLNLFRNIVYLTFAYFVHILGGYQKHKSIMKLAQLTGFLRFYAGYVGGFSRSQYLSAIAQSFPDFTPEDHRRILREFWIDHQRNFLELFMYDAMKEDNIELVVEFQGLEYLRSALFQGKGVILPVPHIGNVRLLHYALALKGFPVSVVSSEYGEDPEIVRRFKLEPTSSVHQVGFRGQFPRWIIDALKENRVLQIASTAEAGAVGVEVQFLGRRLYLTSGWIRLALSSGATVLPTWMMRGADHRHILKILPPLPLFEGNDRQQTINRTCQNLFQLFEPFYRSHPHLIDWMSWLVRLKEAKEHFKDES